MDNFFQLLFGLCVGIGLSAACGFRVFVPLFVMSLAAKADALELAVGFTWIDSWLALVVFGTATALEIASYYVPWIDNLLDAVATPASAIAGTVMTASMVGQLDPMLQWTVGIIVGGGSATAVQALTVATRAGSIATTGGLGNSVVSTSEAVASVGLSVVAIAVSGTVAAIVLAVAVVLLLFWMIRRLLLRRRSRSVIVEAMTDSVPPAVG